MNSRVLSVFHRQNGAATLLMTLVVLALVGSTAVLTGRHLSTEQRISGNHYQTVHIRTLAEAGLEYGLACLQVNLEGDFADQCQRYTAGVSEDFRVDLTFSVEEVDAGSDPVIVAATAVSTVDPNLRAQVRQSVGITEEEEKDMSGFRDLAPLVINGFLDSVTGKPTLSTADPEGMLIISSQPKSDVLPGHFVMERDGQVLDNKQDGILGEGFGEARTAWEYAFGDTTREQMVNLATQTERVQIVSSHKELKDLIGSNEDKRIGSPEEPVILIIDYCAKINGSPEIHGIVYMDGNQDTAKNSGSGNKKKDDGDEDPDCRSHGWGGAKIHGSVISEDSISKFNANGVLQGMAGTSMKDPREMLAPSKSVLRMSRAGGTWSNL